MHAVRERTVDRLTWSNSLRYSAVTYGAKAAVEISPSEDSRSLAALKFAYVSVAAASASSSVAKIAVGVGVGEGFGVGVAQPIRTVPTEIATNATHARRSIRRWRSPNSMQSR